MTTHQLGSMRPRVDVDDPILRIISDLQGDYSHVYDVSPSQDWWHLNPTQQTARPTQGWKLHLSATPAHAASLLEAVARYLMDQKVRWKVCRSVNHLVRMTRVPAPLSQVGKFITIYPRDEEQLLHFAAALHEKTKGFSGPVIPSDYRYAEGSQVYCRYGSFEPRDFYDASTGLRTGYILDLDGQRVADQRRPGRYHPAWVANPFPRSKPHESTKNSQGGLFGKQLVVQGILRQSAKGGVYLVAGQQGVLVLKEARFGTNSDISGRDARDRLTNEFKVLSRLSHLGLTPRPYELFEADGNRYLLMEHIVGGTLRAYIQERNYLGDGNTDLLRQLCSSVIEIVERCHTTGVIIRDLTPDNVIVTADGCKLIDLELAHISGSSDPPFRGFTHGYVPHGTEEMDRDTARHDVYALGAVLFFIVTGIDPFLTVKDSFSPRKEEVARAFLRVPELLDIAKLATSYMTWSGVHESRKGWYYKAASADASPDWLPVLRKGEALPFDKNILIENAVSKSEELYHIARWDSTKRLWPGTGVGDLIHPASFQTGSSGIAYFLCEVAQATGDLKYYDYAREVMKWTLYAHPFAQDATPVGLYFGYSAVPWVMAQIADGLDDARFRAKAIEVSHRIAKAPVTGLDITHGAAGVGLMHLELYRRTGAGDQIQHAVALAHHIARQAEEDESGRVTWKVQGRTWGFAHGVAGLAYYLLAVYAQTGETLLRDLAYKAEKSLVLASIPTVRGRGRTWTKSPTDSTKPWTHWCNGAAGVGNYFLLAADLFDDPDLLHMALLAANTISFGHAFGSCCQCHGLAGDGDYLIEVSRRHGNDREIAEGAYRTARKLHALRLETKSGWAWPTGEDIGAAPDYMLGDCGVYSFLLRLFCKNIPRPLLPDVQ